MQKCQDKGEEKQKCQDEGEEKPKENKSDNQKFPLLIFNGEKIGCVAPANRQQQEQQKNPNSF